MQIKYTSKRYINNIKQNKEKLSQLSLCCSITKNTYRENFFLKRTLYMVIEAIIHSLMPKTTAAREFACRVALPQNMSSPVRNSL